MPERRRLRLDNAAKIYPAAKRRHWSNLFRQSVTLSEDVDVSILKEALAFTVPRFPSIAVRLRRGAFWFYLEELEEAPSIERDRSCPCTPMRASQLRRCAFRVLVYGKRIAVEFFHALTDGNGALIFLKTLTAEYLRRRYGIAIPCEEGVLDLLVPPDEGELEDSYLRFAGEVTRSRREALAYRLRGTMETDRYNDLITGLLPAEQVVEAAHRYGVSVTVYLTAALLYVLQDMQKEDVKKRSRRRPIKVLVPVNLRSFFDSHSLRNFVYFVTPGLDPRMGDYSFEELCKSVHHQLGVAVTKKEMSARITTNVRSEQNPVLKVMPLFIKNLSMKLIYNAVGEKTATINLSNLGAVKLPDAMRPYVTRFDFILGPQATTVVTCGTLSYDGTMTVNFLRTIEETELERRFFRFLRGEGLIAKLESNQRS